MIGLKHKNVNALSAAVAGIILSAVAISVPVSAGGNIYTPETISAEMTENRIGGGYSASGQLDGAGYTAKLYAPKLLKALSTMLF